MALVVAKDFTDEIADSIFEGAETREQAHERAEVIQDQIEFDFNTKLRDEEAARRERREEEELDDRRAERRASRSEREHVTFLIPGDGSDSESDQESRVCYASITRQLKMVAPESIVERREAERTLDTDDELEVETDDEDYLPHVTVRLDKKWIPFATTYMGDHDSVFSTEIQHVESDDIESYCRALRMTGFLSRTSKTWVTTLLEMVARVRASEQSRRPPRMETRASKRARRK